MCPNSFTPSTVFTSCGHGRPRWGTLPRPSTDTADAETLRPPVLVAGRADWLALIAALVNAGFTPDYWLLHLEGAELPYPTSTVILFALLGTVELVVAALIVRPWKLKRLWLRLLIAFALLVLWSVPWMLSAMHQPPVQGMHLLWLLLLDVGLLLALCGVSAVSAWRAFISSPHGCRRRRRAEMAYAFQNSCMDPQRTGEGQYLTRGPQRRQYFHCRCSAYASAKPG